MPCHPSFFLHLSAPLLLSLQEVRWDELDELVMEDVQNLATQELQLVLLAWEKVVHDLHQRSAQGVVL